MSSRNNQLSSNQMIHKTLTIKQQPKTNIFKLSNLDPVKSKFLLSIKYFAVSLVSKMQH